ncbi:MAG TPA: glycosyltransferase family 2 protein [Candidatus Saccharimonadales bacterium]|nr:glycosyltransferase family 2 protein [Candidatus Saccharimonadales bacterium]
MDWASQCGVVIPCLDEAATIRRIVEEVRAILPEVWVVDDGSADGTAALAEQGGAKVIRSATSQGKGRALRMGWEEARKRGLSWVISMDGDGQHLPADIRRFLARAEAGAVDLVIGNRMSAPAGMPWLRRTVNGWMSRKLSRHAGIFVPDSQCGFRMMRLEAYSKVKLETDHYEIESEVLLAFARAKLQIDFVPIAVIYRQEQSKIHPLRDTVRWFRWVRTWKDR